MLDHIELLPETAPGQPASLSHILLLSLAKKSLPLLLLPQRLVKKQADIREGWRVSHPLLLTVNHRVYLTWGVGGRWYYLTQGKKVL